MCGICGYVGTVHTPELLRSMCNSMTHRGPDNSGCWQNRNQEVGLGHRRLSIIDVSPNGHQPMTNEDGSIVITYNGELYNFAELRKWLVNRGHIFRSHTDTEVLVHLYEEHGTDMLLHLNGMFAFAIWDSNRGRLMLARDHAGIKPLYYWKNNGSLVFASEIKALLRVPGVPRRLNRRAVRDYLTFLWVPGEETMLADINKLEPGQRLVWQSGQCRSESWFKLNYTTEQDISDEDWLERVHDTFTATIRRQMVADVPLGAFLSGGLDSSSIVACMRSTFPQREIKCYTSHATPEDMRRDQFADDLPYAEQVAAHLNISLKSYALKPNILDLLPKMVWHLDEPDADPAVFPSYLIAKFAREDGIKVLLSGTGGDEVFFGYRSHQAYRTYAGLDWAPTYLTGPALSAATALASFQGAQFALARRLRKFRSGLLARGLARHLAIVDWSSPTTRKSLLTRELAEEVELTDPVPECFSRYWNSFEGEGEINRHTHLLIHTFLAAHNFLYADKSSMAESVEVRVPFLDKELLELTARMPERLKLRNTVTKYPLKKTMEKYLPKQVLYRSKSGFGAPLRKWIAEDLCPIVDELLSEKRLSERGLFAPVSVRQIIDDNQANRADHAYLLYALLTLEIWQQTFIDRPGLEVVV